MFVQVQITPCRPQGASIDSLEKMFEKFPKICFVSNGTNLSIRQRAAIRRIFSCHLNFDFPLGSVPAHTHRYTHTDIPKPLSSTVTTMIEAAAGSVSSRPATSTRRQRFCYLKIFRLIGQRHTHTHVQLVGPLFPFAPGR